MRVLCDQNVPWKYPNALRETDGVTVTTVDAALEHDASDAEIARFSETDGWA